VRAAKAFSENGDLLADTESRGCDKPPLAVNGRLKEPHELVAGTAQILGKYAVGVTFRDEYVPAQPLGEEAGPEHGGAVEARRDCGGGDSDDGGKNP
jgi:hypothetical protein